MFQARALGSYAPSPGLSGLIKASSPLYRQCWDTSAQGKFAPKLSYLGRWWKEPQPDGR